MKSKNKQKNLGIMLILVGITIIVCILLFISYGGEFFSETAQKSFEFEEEQSAIAAANAASIAIPGFESAAIPAGETNVRMYLYNPEANQCYFEISLILAEGNETIYTSKMISPGQKLYEIELSHGLEPGAYDAVLHYAAYSIVDFSEQNGANVPFTLMVE